MKFIDSVYGEEEIEEQVLIDLINSNAVQRLKGVSQQGVPLKYNSQPPFSRFDHSMGVMVLLRKLGASLEEQIAGLLHDISHPAFSHVLDWVVGDPVKQKHQDSQYLSVLKDSDVPEILSRYGFDVSNFEDLDKFTLLERESPDLCADRIDYSLRDLDAHGGGILLDRFVQHLIVHEGRIVFDSPNAAHQFALEFIFLHRYSWSDDRNVARYNIFADVLKKALEKGIVSQKDFMKTDLEVLQKLEGSGDLEIQKGLRLLKEGFWLNYDVAEGELLQSKFRFVDPFVYSGGVLKRLSEIAPSFKGELDLHRKRYEDKRHAEVLPR